MVLVWARDRGRFAEQVIRNPEVERAYLGNSIAVEGIHAPMARFVIETSRSTSIRERSCPSALTATANRRCMKCIMGIVQRVRAR